jgi:hypothetical protein
MKRWKKHRRRRDWGNIALTAVVFIALAALAIYLVLNGGWPR